MVLKCVGRSMGFYKNCFPTEPTIDSANMGWWTGNRCTHFHSKDGKQGKRSNQSEHKYQSPISTVAAGLGMHSRSLS